MKKFYQEPDVEFIRLVPQDKITSSPDYVDGTTDVESAGDLFG